MTEENQQHRASGSGNAETTLVTPIFDDRAAETAQPVVPLATNASGGSSFVARTAHRIPGAAAGHPSWMLGLIVASILVGSVLGGLGLRFYQKRQSAAAAATVPTVAPSDAPASSAPADDDAPAPVLIEKTETATTAQTSTETDTQNILISDRKEIPATTTTTTSASKPSVTDERGGDAVATKKPEKESKSTPPAVERKRADDDDDDDDEEKGRGRRDRSGRDETRPRRVRNNEQRNQRDSDDNAVPRARMVDSITIEAQRIRRQERRRGAQPPERQTRTVDRVRGIFEGQSPR